METQDSAIHHVWSNFILTTLCLREEKEKHFNATGIEPRPPEDSIKGTPSRVNRLLDGVTYSTLKRTHIARQNNIFH